MKKRQVLLYNIACSVAVLGGFACASAAYAEVYKCVDQLGHVTYTNAKIMANKGCKTIATTSLAPSAPASIPKPSPPSSSSSSASGHSSPSPAGFPKVDDQTQKGRDTDRRAILEDELAVEQKNLAQAKRDLADQEAIRNSDEKNYQKVLDRLQPYKNKVALHQRNTDAINKELDNLR